VAHLATADRSGRPHVVPICYAFDGRALYSPIDEKPKKNPPLLLKRVRNIRANPQVSVVIDRYDEDWQRLAYVLIAGRAQILLKGARHKRVVALLRKKYPQYREMRLEGRPVIQITPIRWSLWGKL
jgi:PPOX class probable F420-dependent enzyme